MSVELFIEFTYSGTNEEMLKSIYPDEKVFSIVFDDPSSNRGTVYIITKKVLDDRFPIMTFDLDDSYYQFYIRNKNNSYLRDIDLRIYYYLNVREEDIKYKFKVAGRPSKLVFNKTNMCAYYDYPIRDQHNIKVACVNDGTYKVAEGKYLCFEHLQK